MPVSVQLFSRPQKVNKTLILLVDLQNSGHKIAGFDIYLEHFMVILLQPTKKKATPQDSLFRDRLENSE